jgi:hypothetical protein
MVFRPDAKLSVGKSRGLLIATAIFSAPRRIRPPMAHYLGLQSAWRVPHSGIDIETYNTHERYPTGLHYDQRASEALLR